MSLPSRALFTKLDGTKVSGFCNIGWFVEERHIPETVMEAAIDAGLKSPLEFTEVTLYGLTYTPMQLKELHEKYK